jgi:hypothetical protein
VHRYCHTSPRFAVWTLLIPWGGVHSARRPLIGLLYQPRMMDYDECGAVGGMRLGRGNRSTRRKPAPVPLRPPQILYDLTWDRTWAAADAIRRLNVWARRTPLTNFSFIPRCCNVISGASYSLPLTLRTSCSQRSEVGCREIGVLVKNMTNKSSSYQNKEAFGKWLEDDIPLG